MGNGGSCVSHRQQRRSPRHPYPTVCIIRQLAHRIWPDSLVTEHLVTKQSSLTIVHLYINLLCLVCCLVHPVLESLQVGILVIAIQPLWTILRRHKGENSGRAGQRLEQGDLGRNVGNANRRSNWALSDRFGRLDRMTETYAMGSRRDL